VVDAPDLASHILINTCGFIREAKEESIAAILEICAAYRDLQVFVAGCLVERYRAELVAGIPEVAGWFGLLTGPEREVLLRVLAQNEKAVPERPTGEARLSSGALTNRPPYAYLKISDGCDGPCTFCAIPGIKGSYQPLSVGEIWGEAQACLAEGARELVLVGQDTACWQSDGLDLTGLIDLLAGDERVSWIRVMYLQPDHVTEHFLRYMACQPKLCRYLDIPFQHSHPYILRRMGRAGDATLYLELLAEARRLAPDVALRSAFIVGFPGETEEHFAHLLEFVQQAEFDYAGGFIYSPEEGTVAARLRPRVRQREARNRLNRLQAVLLESGEAARRGLVGRSVEVMIDELGTEDGGDEFAAVARSRGQAPEVDGVTYIEGELPPEVGVGDVVKVRIEAVVGYDLVGRCDVS